MKRLGIVVVSTLALLMVGMPSAHAFADYHGLNCNDYSGASGNRTIRICVSAFEGEAPLGDFIQPEVHFKEIEGNVYQVKLITIDLQYNDPAHPGWWSHYPVWDPDEVFYPFANWAYFYGDDHGCFFDPNGPLLDMKVRTVFTFRIRFVSNQPWQEVQTIHSENDEFPC